MLVAGFFGAFADAPARRRAQQFVLVPHAYQHRAFAHRRQANHHGVVAGGQAGGAVTGDGDLGIADQVLVSAKVRQRFRQPLFDDGVVAFFAASHGAVIDKCIGREDAVEPVPLAHVDGVGVANHQLLDFNVVGDFLLTQHSKKPFKIYAHLNNSKAHAE